MYGGIDYPWLGSGLLSQKSTVAIQRFANVLNVIDSWLNSEFGLNFSAVTAIRTIVNGLGHLHTYVL